MLQKTIAAIIASILILLTSRGEVQDKEIASLWYSFAMNLKGSSHHGVAFTQQESEKEAMLGCVKKDMLACRVRSSNGPTTFMFYGCSMQGVEYFEIVSGIGDLDETIEYTSKMWFNLRENNCGLVGFWYPFNTKTYSW